MRAVVQRVHFARLSVNDKIVTNIEKGLSVLVGITTDDNAENVGKMAYRIATLRIFQDDKGKLSKSIQDINGQILVVSNFTLCATKKGGTRPDFSLSAPKEKALQLYELLIQKLKTDYNLDAKQGAFGQSMTIDTSLDGPVIYLET